MQKASDDRLLMLGLDMESVAGVRWWGFIQNTINLFCSIKLDQFSFEKGQ